MPAEFHFLRPQWLLALLPLAILLWHLARHRAGGDAWRNLVDPHLLPQLLSDGGGRPRRLPLLLLGLGWLLGVLALAGPAWERLPQPVYEARQYRVLALDLSQTMLATDMAPSRLTHARFEVLDLLRRTREGQTALLAYGPEPYLVAPLTTDTQTIVTQVPHLDPKLLPARGAKRTDLALAMAGELLQQAGAPGGEVILVTDGLDRPAAAIEAAEKLRTRGYRVSILGIGSTKGAPVPLADGGFARAADGSILLTRLEASTLRQLAAAGGGRYVTARLDDRDVDTLAPDHAEPLSAGAEKQDSHADQWQEAGPWLLLAALPLAALGFRRGWLGPLVLMCCVLPPPPAAALDWQDLWQTPDQQGARAFAEGRPGQAARAFERADWRAASAYASGDYQHALEQLEGLQGSQAAYNRGNALAQLGWLEEALAAYDEALAADPDNADARHNRGVVQRLRDERKQQEGSQGQQEAGEKGQPQEGGDPGQQPPPSEEGQQQQAGAEEDAGQDGQSPGEQQQAGGDQAQADDASDGEQAQDGNGEDAEPGDDNGTEGTRGDDGGTDAQGPADRADKPDHAPAGDNDNEPGLSDLLADDTAPIGAQPAGPAANPELEDSQAMEQMLRQVRDDPAGLLRQRFLLQHLRRSGRLP